MSRPLIVFDVDDTLYLETDYVRSGFHAVATYLRGMHYKKEFFGLAWELFMDGRRGTIFDDLMAAEPDLRDVVTTAELVEIYRSHEPDIRLEADAVNLIDQQSLTAHIGIVTDGPAISQWKKINALGLHAWANEIVVTAERGETWTKPHTTAFLYLQQMFGAHPEDCIYIGDNPEKDFTGPAQLGWATVRLQRPGQLHEHELDHICRPTVTVRSFSAISALLRRRQPHASQELRGFERLGGQ